MKTTRINIELAGFATVILLFITFALLFLSCGAPQQHDSLYKSISDSLDSVTSTVTTLPIDSEMKVRANFDTINK